MESNIVYRSAVRGSAYGEKGLYGKRKRVKVVAPGEEVLPLESVPKSLPDLEPQDDEMPEGVPLELHVENRFRQSRDIRMWILQVIIICMIVGVIMYFQYKEDNAEFRAYYREYVFEILTGLLLYKMIDTMFEIFFDKRCWVI